MSISNLVNLKKKSSSCVNILGENIVVRTFWNIGIDIYWTNFLVRIVLDILEKNKQLKHQAKSDQHLVDV